MTDNEINKIIDKIDSLHRKILNSKFAEQVTESEMLSLILAVQELTLQKAEIEQKRKFLSDSLEEIKGLKLKVQIQEQEIKKLQNYGIRADWKEYCRKLITEARKEFAERLKALSEYGTINVSSWQVDNLLKEMESESK